MKKIGTPAKFVTGMWPERLNSNLPGAPVAEFVMLWPTDLGVPGLSPA